MVTGMGFGGREGADLGFCREDWWVIWGAEMRG